MARLNTTFTVDEEALGAHFDATTRRRGGIYFTPSWLVKQVIDAVAPFVPARGRLTVVDPACGAGAFLSAAGERFARARLVGCELSGESATHCRQRLPGATILAGDALRGEGRARLERTLDEEDSFELWLGNPPYNGRSALLDDPVAFAQMQRLLVPQAQLSKGQSLRDDFAFFLLTAAQRLSSRRGALAFVTSASLLDAFLYAPLRQTLGSKLTFRSAVDLGAGAFQGTKVKTCFSVWTSERSGEVETLEAPQFRLRRPSRAAAELQAAWAGEPITRLVPISLPGLKTRFDELLTDVDPERLLARLRELMRTTPSGLGAFAARHAIPSSCLKKLEALPRNVEIEARRVRPFIRYRGALPRGAAGFCYVDRALIPRGDHRLRGAWDPHVGSPKLVFNIRELPLWAEVIDEPGCVTAYQHARFAPLWVPERIRAGDAKRPAEDSLEALGPLVPNLSSAGLKWAERLGGPEKVFQAIARFIRSEDVQKVWAPEFATSEEIIVPFG